MIAGAVSMGAALIGALAAVRAAAVLPPAEAMRPPAPPLFRRSRLSQLALSRALDRRPASC